MGRRTQDLVLSAAALALLWPLMGLVALAIWLDSPGASPIFVQERVGRDGRLFRFYKFRSMVPDAEARLAGMLDQNEMDGPVFKIRDDPRVTRVGRFLRRTGIDELPQLVNILKSDMSMVELDLQYIQERSFWLDWKIIARTFRTVLRMYGA